MDTEQYKSFLLNRIPGSVLAAGGKEVLCRCFFCPDSSDPRSKHFYISIPKHDNDLSLCHCFKCNTSGVMNAQKLIEFGIFDIGMSIMLTQHNNTAYVNPSNYKYLSTGVYTLDNSFVTKDDLSQRKLNYINSRLGINLGYDEILQNKIVLNLNDLLKSNNITELTRDPRIIESLDAEFVGFISYDNCFVNLKNLASDKSKLHPSLQKRYVNYNIFGNEDNTKKFYVPPTKIDTYKLTKLHIGEGPFDALSIKYNLRKDFDNNLYSAVTGNAYKLILRYLISSVQIINMEIHLYPDNDMDKWALNNILQYIKPFKYPTYIHRNLIGKDMGESMDKIQEYIEKI